MINTSITPQQIAWVAGIYEGEGSLTPKPDGQWQLVVTMTDRDIIDRLHICTGMGTVRTMKPGREHWKVPYRWTVSKQSDLASLLWMIRPHLGLRRGARADEFLAWIVAGSPSRTTDEAKAIGRARQAKHRGWVEPRTRTTV